MDRLQVPIIPYFLEDQDYLENGELEMLNMNMSMSMSMEDNKPFLQMLHSVESQIPFPYPLIQEPNFQFLLGLQHQKLMKPLEDQIATFVTNNNDRVMESESCTRENPVSEINQRPPKVGKSSNKRIVGANKERRKMLSTKRMKKKEQVESQRMTHIAVERNRRRQMNEHLNVLRSLMPPSYVQRGDQASIIGGAIDYVNELEHLLQSLQARKRMRQLSNENDGISATFSSSWSSSNLLSSLFMESSSSSSSSSAFHFRYSEDQELNAENKSGLAEIQVVVIQNDVNLKIQCQRRSGQLLKAIVALENLGLSVLHLNITSLHSFVRYSFNLEIEDDCKLGSPEEVASAAHQIFTLINAG